MSAGNIGFQMNTMVPANAASTSEVRTIFETSDGMLLGYTNGSIGTVVGDVATTVYASGCVIIQAIAAATASIYKNSSGTNTSTAWVEIAT